MHKSTYLVKPWTVQTTIYYSDFFVGVEFEILHSCVSVLQDPYRLNDLFWSMFPIKFLYAIVFCEHLFIHSVCSSNRKVRNDSTAPQGWRRFPFRKLGSNFMGLVGSSEELGKKRCQISDRDPQYIFRRVRKNTSFNQTVRSVSWHFEKSLTTGNPPAMI